MIQVKSLPKLKSHIFARFTQSMFQDNVGSKAKGSISKRSSPNYPKSDHFLPPDTNTYLCVSGGKKCSFFGKFGVLCFFETPVLRFALLPYYRRTEALPGSEKKCSGNKGDKVLKNRLNKICSKEPLKIQSVVFYLNR